MAQEYLLLVSNNEKGFIVNSIVEALKKEEIQVRNVQIDELGLGVYIEGSLGVFIADSYENQHRLNAIKGKCYELNKQVILYGSPAELDAMKRVFVDSMIHAEFLRPAEMEEIVKQVKLLRIKAENQNNKKTVLVVDDSPIMLRTMMEWLEDKYTVLLSKSASAALDVLYKERPDLILLDYEMPICTGAQFMEILSRQDETKNIPIIFLTSRSDEKTVKEVMQLKPKGYILKSTPQELLLKKINQFFENQQAEQLNDSL